MTKNKVQLEMEMVRVVMNMKVKSLMMVLWVMYRRVKKMKMNGQRQVTMFLFTV